MIAIVAATAGGLFALGRSGVSHRVLCAFVSFAAGSLLAVTVIHIVPETAYILGVGLTVLTLAGGIVVFGVIGKYVSVLCPACAASATDAGYLRLGILLMIAMGVHSTVDGLAIGAGSVTLSSIGLMIVLAVSYHKIPEGLALVSVARLAGYGRAKALGVTVLIELTTALGAFAGFIFLPGGSQLMLGITLGIVAGSFLYTIGFALLKEMYAHERASIFLYVGLGFASIVVLSMLVSLLGVSQH